MRILLLGTLSLAIALGGCGINPVTGKSQITLMSQEQENQIGAQQFAPSQQSQGGTYTLDEGLNAYVSRVGKSLAKYSAQPNLPYEFVVLNSDDANAWALPGGKIAINRGLLLLMKDEAQLAAVLAHEIVHAAARHGAEQHATGAGIQVLGSILQSQTDNALLKQGAALGGGAAHAHYGRDNEFEADRYSIDYMVAAGYDPKAAVELQQTFVELSKNRSKGNVLSRLFATHPPSIERVRANQARIQALGNPKGKRNKAPYQNAIRQIVKDKGAYALHKEALNAAGKKEWDKSLSLTNLAIRRQPREARFHITKGRLLREKDNDKQAISAFNRAVQLEPRYFSGFFHRGLTHHNLKNYRAARQDLLASNKLLETGAANYYLGEIALQTKNRNEAVQCYRRASNSGGDIGKAAISRLRQLGAN